MLIFAMIFSPFVNIMATLFQVVCLSNSRLANLLVTIVARVLIIVAPFAAEGQAAQKPTPQPTAHNTGTYLLASHFLLCSRQVLLRAVGALYLNRATTPVNSRRSLKLLKLFGAQKFTKFIRSTNTFMVDIG